MFSQFDIFFLLFAFQFMEDNCMGDNNDRSIEIPKRAAEKIG